MFLDHRLKRGMSKGRIAPFALAWQRFRYGSEVSANLRAVNGRVGKTSQGEGFLSFMASTTFAAMNLTAFIA
jgi:hypothetical protein